MCPDPSKLPSQAERYRGLAEWVQEPGCKILLAMAAEYQALAGAFKQGQTKSHDRPWTSRPFKAISRFLAINENIDVVRKEHPDARR
jgi:hypothetical protein